MSKTKTKIFPPFSSELIFYHSEVTLQNSPKISQKEHETYHIITISILPIDADLENK